MNSCRSGYGCKWPPSNWLPPRPIEPKPQGCPPGYGYQTAQPSGKTVCVTCASGTYSPGGFSICLRCGNGEGYATPRLASSADACVCYAGHGGPGCTLCPPRTYSPGVQVKTGKTARKNQLRPACRVCPDTTLGSAAPGAAAVSQCGGCVPGTGGLRCQTCPRGTFSPGGSFDNCTSCGPNQTSWPGAEGPDSCMCQAGFGANGTASCVTCPPNTWWAGPPPEPQRSLEGKVELSATAQATGASTVEGMAAPQQAVQASSVAAPGNERPFIQSCLACPTNWTSPAGSTSFSNCTKP
eukprot:gene6340-biopygen8075